VAPRIKSGGICSGTFPLPANLFRRRKRPDDNSKSALISNQIFASLAYQLFVDGTSPEQIDRVLKRRILTISQRILQPHNPDRFVRPDLKAGTEDLISGVDEPAVGHHFS